MTDTSRRDLLVGAAACAAAAAIAPLVPAAAPVMIGPTWPGYVSFADKIYIGAEGTFYVHGMFDSGWVEINSIPAIPPSV